ncbi:MAG TPA: aminopeptidase [Steroidobacteraceae bacterium]|nr:aminopeptidase [Steroidobacteraceae bacterium]
MLTRTRNGIAGRLDRGALSARCGVRVRLGLAALAVLALPGCGTLYLLQAAHGEMQVLDNRRPISEVIADPQTSPQLRGTLEEVVAARDFASRSLGEPDNRSYRTYSDIHRRFVVWNVVAAPEFSVEPKEWCFLIAGCVAYRGYFSEHAAVSFAAKLKADGYDVIVDDVPAYSTLGHFADPVLSTMIPYGTVELDAIIFHELAHQLLYVANDSSFNEAFATTVEEEGIKRWLHARGRDAELARFRRASDLDQQYIRLFRGYRERLQRLYASHLAVAQMRARKRAVFDELAADMRRIEARTGEPSPYGDWLAQGLNNADLASVATYYDCVPGFEQLLHRDGDDLIRFYGDVRKLAREKQAERDAAVCAAPPGQRPVTAREAERDRKAARSALSARPSRGSDRSAAAA